MERSKKEGPIRFDPTKARNNKVFCFDENSLVKKYVIMMMGQNFSAEKKNCELQFELE